MESEGYEIPILSVHLCLNNLLTIWQFIIAFSKEVMPLRVTFEKYELGGHLKVKIQMLFYGDSSWTVAL
jgi:hypothetical protein